ncbi:SnoaL-like domain-containing protein [Aspergillus cavernicola]|uniref:SnoaL-like domain-containing protein n=1 Tax=Aspergillus cavernicola TaxID=176166 RepID=A0ABR4HZQ2_9EURO
MAQTSDHELIRNAIANIAIAFDTNTFPEIRHSFTGDCVADYVGSLGLMTGIDTVITGLQKTIGHISTFHGLNTQSITLTGEETAEATTYCSASHYLGDKAFFAEARYFDKLVKVTEGGVVKWLIKDRLVTMMGVPRGDVSIFNMDLDAWVDSLKA